MAWSLRVLTTLAGFPASSSGGSQLPVTLVLGDPVLSSGLCGYCTDVTPALTYIHML